MDSETLRVGDRVTVTQQVQHKGWTLSVTGVVESAGQRKTGSWFAHAKDDKLWLDRLVLQKDDGEVVVCNLDRYSRIEVLGAGDGVAAGDAKAPEESMRTRGSVTDVHDEVQA